MTKKPPPPFLNRLRNDLVDILLEISGQSTMSNRDVLMDKKLNEDKAKIYFKEVKARLGIDIDVYQFLKNSTINNLIRLIRETEVKKQISEAKQSNPVIKKSISKPHYPLSHAQKRMWVLNRLESESSFYNIRHTRNLAGKLNARALAKAIYTLQARHEVLRTNIREIAGNPVQIIHKLPRTDLKTIDISKLTQRDKETKERQIIKQVTQTPFKLEIDPLTRFTLIKKTKDEYTFIITIHHIISDGWSMNIIHSELARLYNAYSRNQKLRLSEPPIQYKDYVEWEQSKENTIRLAKQEKYWLKKLSGDLPALNLPTDYPRPPVQTYRGNIKRIIIDERTTGKLKKLAQKESTTLFTLLLTCYYVLLYRLTGQTDIIVGTVKANRDLAELKNIIGPLINNLSMRSRISANDTFRTLLARVKQTTLEAIDNGDYSFEYLIEKLNVPRDTSRSPMFSTMFMFDEWLNKSGAMRHLKITPRPPRRDTVNFDFKIRFRQIINNKIIFICEYSTDLFKEDTINRFLGIFKALINEVVSAPDKNISKYEIITKEEKQELVHDYNNTTAPYPKNKTLHQLFHKQAASTPNNIAVIDTRAKLTYQELNDKSERLAEELIARGVKKNTVVGLMTNRNSNMIIGALGILKAGGIFMFIDPNYPQERIKYILANSHARLIVAELKYLDKYDFAQDTININTVLKNKKNFQKITPSKQDSNSGAYIMYTSGTTGYPKGVVCSHRSVINYLDYLNKKYKTSANDSILQITSMSFDPSIRDIFAPLIVGAKVIVLSNDQKNNPEMIVNAIEKHKITKFFSIIPRFLDEVILAANKRPGDLKTLKAIFTCGEQLYYSTYIKAKEVLTPNTKIINQYGPTEVTMVSCLHEVKSIKFKEGSVPIGMPIQNTQAYILNSYLKLQPIGIAGELYISGDGLARGYLNAPSKTKEVFLQHPFLKGHKIYKTGDLARMHPDGNIEILGRVDHQVKIRGYRIEPGEIEYHLKRLDQIKEVLVMAHTDEKTKDKYLTAYYISGQPIELQKFKDYLKKYLQDYMTPRYFIRLDKFPLNPNGKINRAKLPIPTQKDLKRSKYEAPHTEAERKLARIWQKVLDIDKAGRHDNFFNLGGHSLKAIQAVSRINDSFRIELPLREIFVNSTIATLSAHIESMTQNKEKRNLPILSFDFREYYPLTKSQEILWDATQSLDPIALNEPMAMEYIGYLNKIALYKALKEIINRHEALRANFVSRENWVVQKIKRKINFKIDYLDLTDKSVPVYRRDIIKIIKRELNQSFDLTKDLLLRAKLMKINNNRHILLLVSHIIIFDDDSRLILQKEIRKLYGYFLDKSVKLPKPLHFKYSDYLIGESKKNLGKQEKYWFDKFADSYPIVDLPVDKPRKLVNTIITGNIIPFKIDQKIVNSINDICHTRKITHFMFFLASLNIFLYKITNQTDLIVGAAVNRRTNEQMNQILGMLVTNIGFRNNINKNKKFSDHLNAIKKTTIEALANSDTPLRYIVTKIGRPVPVPPNRLLTNVFLRVLYINKDSLEVRVNDKLIVRPFRHGFKGMPFDIQLAVTINNNDIIFRLMYNPHLFYKRTINKLISVYRKLLEDITQNPNNKISEL